MGADQPTYNRLSAFHLTGNALWSADAILLRPHLIYPDEHIPRSAYPSGTRQPQVNPWRLFAVTFSQLLYTSVCVRQRCDAHPT